MATAMIGPKFYAFDDGEIVPFARLYTYAARTNIPKKTYQSEDGIVENSNPIIMNGDGYADVYLDGSYKIVLKDADDVEIYTEDPVTGVTTSEWINCQDASYESPSIFSVQGNKTSEFEEGRRVRLDNSIAFEYGTVKNSSFSVDKTNVEILEGNVPTALAVVCTSIVGPNSSRPIDSAITIDNISKIVENRPFIDGQLYNFTEYDDGSEKGGFDAIYLSSKAKNLHNGITVFSDTVPYNSDINLYQSGVGEPDSAGFGCFVSKEVKHDLYQVGLDYLELIALQF